MKIEARPFESLWEASEPLNRSLPWLYRKVSVQVPLYHPCKVSDTVEIPVLQGLNIFSSASPSKVLPDSASPPAAKEGEGLPQPQVGPGRLTQLHPSAQPWVWNQHQDQAGKPPASLAPAAPSSETSEQNVLGWELKTGVCSLLQICKRPSRCQRRSLLAPPRPTGGR